MQDNEILARKELINAAFNDLRNKGLIRSQKDLANLLGVSGPTISRALAGDARFLTPSLMAKINAYINYGTADVPLEWVREFPAIDSPNIATEPAADSQQLLVIPVDAMAGTLGEFAASVEGRSCERLTSPVRGADYAIRVAGDSMAPVYPSGCLVLIKKVNEKAFIEWGKVYVLDTVNGAVIKQIQPTADDAVIQCVSLNEKYKPYEIEKQFIYGWYRVLMVLTEQ